MLRESAIAGKVLRGSLKKKVAGITDSRARRNGRRKKFYMNFIVNTSSFLYN